MAFFGKKRCFFAYYDTFAVFVMVGGEGRGEKHFAANVACPLFRAVYWLIPYVVRS